MADGCNISSLEDTQKKSTNVLFCFFKLLTGFKKSLVNTVLHQGSTQGSDAHQVLLLEPKGSNAHGKCSLLEAGMIMLGV